MSAPVTPACPIRARIGRGGCDRVRFAHSLRRLHFPASLFSSARAHRPSVCASSSSHAIVSRDQARTAMAAAASDCSLCSLPVCIPNPIGAGDADTDEVGLGLPMAEGVEGREWAIAVCL